MWRQQKLLWAVEAGECHQPPAVLRQPREEMHLSEWDFRVQQAAVTRSAPASGDNILHLPFTSHLPLINGCLSSRKDHQLHPPGASRGHARQHACGSADASAQMLRQNVTWKIASVAQRERRIERGTKARAPGCANSPTAPLAQLLHITQDGNTKSATLALDRGRIVTFPLIF